MCLVICCSSQSAKNGLCASVGICAVDGGVFPKPLQLVFHSVPVIPLAFQFPHEACYSEILPPHELKGECLRLSYQTVTKLEYDLVGIMRNSSLHETAVPPCVTHAVRSQIVPRIECETTLKCQSLSFAGTTKAKSTCSQAYQISSIHFNTHDGVSQRA